MQNSFRTLQRVWRSNNIFKKIYNVTVKSILLYGSETRKLLKAEENKIDAFYTKCYRNIVQLYWLKEISNIDFYQKVNSYPLTKAGL